MIFETIPKSRIAENALLKKKPDKNHVIADKILKYILHPIK
jgi:hypothetical protein